MLRRASFFVLLLAAAGCTQHPPCVSAPTFYRQADDIRYHIKAMKRVLPSLPASERRAGEEAQRITDALNFLSNTAREAAPDASQTFADAATFFDRANPSRHERYVQALTDTGTAIDSFTTSLESPFCPTDY